MKDRERMRGEVPEFRAFSMVMRDLGLVSNLYRQLIKRTVG